MASEEHLSVIRKGAREWNDWRLRHDVAEPDLRGADLRGEDFSGVNLSGADLTKALLFEVCLDTANLAGAKLIEADLVRVSLRGANLTGADLTKVRMVEANLIEANFSRAVLDEANLHGAKLNGANLNEANMIEADVGESDLRGASLQRATLTRANLSFANLNGADATRAALNGAYMWGANLFEAKLPETDLNDADLTIANLGRAELQQTNMLRAILRGADLGDANFNRVDMQSANLSEAILIRTDLTGANLSGCRIFGISAWKLKLEKTIQSDLIITDENEPVITVDNLEIAQFLYLLIHNEKLRDVIDTIGKKAVLILGRFTPERKVILDALRNELRVRRYIPILFDFEKPESRDLTETIVTLAHLSRFIIADITDAKSIPQELQAIVPILPSVAVQPIIHSSQRQYAMFERFQRFPWVLPLHEYDTQEQLIADLPGKIIQPAEKKVNEMRPQPLS